MLVLPFQSFSPVNFIAAGQSMVAPGAAAAVGLAQASEAEPEASAQPGTEDVSKAQIDQCLSECVGRRLECRLAMLTS